MVRQMSFRLFRWIRDADIELGAGQKECSTFMPLPLWLRLEATRLRQTGASSDAGRSDGAPGAPVDASRVAAEATTSTLS
jgi:hypothetical protein